MLNTQAHAWQASNQSITNAEGFHCKALMHEARLGLADKSSIFW